ncbi:hypothetical protein [Streptomyces sp. C10-9-1]|uniref:hypothetical protein n=1 Tax=Streptomyces sp. C10-9-1 TaxID=1859285 RepID=UPI003D7080FD
MVSPKDGHVLLMEAPDDADTDPAVVADAGHPDGQHRTARPAEVPEGVGKELRFTAAELDDFARGWVRDRDLTA